MRAPKPDFKKAKAEIELIMGDLGERLKLPKIKDIFKSKNGNTLACVKEIQETDDLVIIRLKGAIDYYTIPVLAGFGRKNGGRAERYLNKHILLDFKEVTHIDGSTLASLIQLLSELKRRKRKLGIINATLFLKNYLSIARLTSAVAIYGSEKKAVRALLKS